MRNDYNLNIYESSIKYFIGENINIHDLKYIANKAAKIYNRLDNKYGCVDNFRVSLVESNQVSNLYKEAEDRGCCGFFDEDFTNKLTNNTFRIGFNYGH